VIRPVRADVMPDGSEVKGAAPEEPDPAPYVGEGLFEGTNVAPAGAPAKHDDSAFCVPASFFGAPWFTVAFPEKLDAPARF
jgi:hypothetical protein